MPEVTISSSLGRDASRASVMTVRSRFATMMLASASSAVSSAWLAIWRLSTLMVARPANLSQAPKVRATFW